MRAPLRIALLFAQLMSFGSWHGASAQQSSASIEDLLAQGWEIAGYVAAWENRSLILFRHKDHKYLVQCSILIDVLRTPRTVRTCYEIR